MNDESIRKLATAGGTCGAAGMLLYFAGAFLPLPDNIAYAIVMLWPILSIVMAYAFYRLVGASRQGALNGIAFVYACIAFATLASMISVQLAVKMGIAEYASKSPEADRALFDAIRRSVRMVDLGIDVSWDFFIGAYLALIGVVLAGYAPFGRVWGSITSVLGVALVVLNVITFPWPPDTRGLFDIGPFIGLFIIALNVRMITIGMRRPGEAGSQAA